MSRYTFCTIIFVISLVGAAKAAGFSQYLPFSETCMAAKLAYWANNNDVFLAVLDPVWHFQNSPVSEGRVWPIGMCNSTSIYPNESICSCPDAANWFVEHYTWLPENTTDAFLYWVNHQNYADGGIVWHGEYCFNATKNMTNGKYILPYQCTCLAAQWDYLARYKDVANAHLDPVIHYENSGHAEDRFWDCTLCNQDPIYSNNSICNCTAAAKNYTSMYPWHLGLTLDNAFGVWLATYTQTQEYWPCNLCISSSSGPNIRGFSPALSGGIGVIVALGGVLGIFAVVMLGVHWTVFQPQGSFYSAVIIFGVMIGYVAALTLLPEPTDVLCVVFPWLLGISFVLVYGCLFIKTWILYRVWKKAVHYKRSSITATYILKCVGLALGFEVAFLIIWTVVDPPKVHLLEMVDGTYQNQCKSNSTTFWAIFIVVKGAWLLFGVVLSIITRNIVKEYNESNSIAYAIYNDIGLAVIAIPLSFVLAPVPGGALVVEVAAIVLSFSFTLCILFFNTWYAIFFQEKDFVGEKLKSMAQRQSTISTASATSTARSSMVGFAINTE